MKVFCPECKRHVGTYTGPTTRGLLIESKYFEYPNGRSPARGGSSVYTCVCKHRFDIIGEMKKIWRTEVLNASNQPSTVPSDEGGSELPGSGGTDGH